MTPGADIVVPLDGSGKTETALAFAAGLARACCGPLHLLLGTAS